MRLLRVTWLPTTRRRFAPTKNGTRRFWPEYRREDGGLPKNYKVRLSFWLPQPQIMLMATQLPLTAAGWPDNCLLKLYLAGSSAKFTGRKTNPLFESLAEVLAGTEVKPGGDFLDRQGGVKEKPLGFFDPADSPKTNR